jgi:hypothetical protein
VLSTSSKLQDAGFSANSKVQDEPHGVIFVNKYDGVKVEHQDFTCAERIFETAGCRFFS